MSAPTDAGYRNRRLKSTANPQGALHGPAAEWQNTFSDTHQLPHWPTPIGAGFETSLSWHIPGPCTQSPRDVCQPLYLQEIGARTGAGQVAASRQAPRHREMRVNHQTSSTCRQATRRSRHRGMRVRLSTGPDCQDLRVASRSLSSNGVHAAARLDAHREHASSLSQRPHHDIPQSRDRSACPVSALRRSRFGSERLQLDRTHRSGLHVPTHQSRGPLSTARPTTGWHSTAPPRWIARAAHPCAAPAAPTARVASWRARATRPAPPRTRAPAASARLRRRPLHARRRSALHAPAPAVRPGCHTHAAAGRPGSGAGACRPKARGGFVNREWNHGPIFKK